MVRPILSEAERERGRRLGASLREARGERSMADVSVASGIPVETLRKIETGRIVTPAFFTVAALAGVLGLDLATLADQLSNIGHSVNPAETASPNSRYGDHLAAPHAMVR
jgi:transcriptional regulator with XRE-family HTH domain